MEIDIYLCIYFSIICLLSIYLFTYHPPIIYHVSIYLSVLGSSVVKNPPASAEDARDMGSIPRLERSPREGNGNRLQYSCLENSMHRRVWWAKVHGVTKSQTQLSD